ncbi:hypothetical protein [Pyrococcus kukulkanii]|uniref:hypothetical protein n=1 Tax=Pyrococcus kukulkanii TaxID=1609559 RepID=UPI003562A201
MSTKGGTWVLLRLRYLSDIYLSKVTSHFAGDMLVMEEIGEVSEPTARKILEMGEVTPETLPALNLNELPDKDRKVIERAISGEWKALKVIRRERND